MSRAIPDRWIPYKACGNEIEGTRIICFKVPLKPQIQANNPEITTIWDIKALLKKVPNLGLVIDLTNTTRYYDPKLLRAAGVKYKKLFMPGRVIPPENIVNEFMDSVDDFLSENKDQLIGVHCTHGLNRTGYMVCRYMKDRLSIEPKEAIKRFEIARGYPIERKNYVAHILGNPVPPPEEGPGTSIIPHNRHNESYNSIPDQSFSESTNIKRNKEEGCSGYRRSRDRDNEQRFNRCTPHKTQVRSRSRSTSSVSSNDYDYRYDY